MSKLIPRELIAQIFLDFSVKALTRLRCLSKSWCSIIDGKVSIRPKDSDSCGDQYLNDMYLDHAKRRKTNLHVILTHSDISPPSDIQTIAFDDDEKASDETMVTTLCNPLKQRKQETVIVGSCNGLLCLDDLTSQHCNLLVWNPFARKYKALDRLEYSDHGQTFLGFGFDEANSDYKVVRILVSDDPDQHPCEVNVYSLQSSSWKRLDDFPYNGYSLEGEGWGCFCDGSLHWLAINRLLSLSVVCFNLAFAEFEEIAIPDCVRSDVDLQVMDGKLCLLEVYQLISIDIWMLENHGEENSWMKMYTLSKNDVFFNLMNVRVLTCSKNGQRILLSNNRDLIWYDLQENTSKKVKLRGLPPCPHFVACMCFESLDTLGNDAIFDGN